ncbi:MAG: ABC transporter, partial [Planctomycetota bacterium]
TAIILVTHDLGIVHSYVKTIACLNRRLHYHHAKEVTREMVEETYGCPVDFVVHSHTHRILGPHPEE